MDLIQSRIVTDDAYLPFIGGLIVIAGIITMALVAGISDEHAGIASSMFNAGQRG